MMVLYCVWCVGNRFKITFYCFCIPRVASRNNISVIRLTRFRIRTRTCARDQQVNAPNGQKAKCQLNEVLSMRIVVSRDWITLTHMKAIRTNRQTAITWRAPSLFACGSRFVVFAFFLLPFTTVTQFIIDKLGRDINKWKCQTHQHLSGF